MFEEMKEQLMSVSEIARRTGVSRPMVMKHVLSEKPPKRGFSSIQKTTCFIQLMHSLACNINEFLLIEDRC